MTGSAEETDFARQAKRSEGGRGKKREPLLLGFYLVSQLKSAF